MTSVAALRFEALGGQCELYAADTPGSTAPTSVEQTADLAGARTWIHEMHDRLSRFDPASEISRLNAAAGRWLDVGADVEALLRRSLDAFAASGGLVHIGVLPALLAAGYTRDFAAGPGVPTGEVLLAPPLPAILERARCRERLRVERVMRHSGIATDVDTE